MRALVVEAPGRCRVGQVPEPAAGRGEVLLRVLCCGVCGTDLRIVAGDHPPARLPLVIGHEIAAEVVETGRPVAVDPVRSCGRCDPCRRGRAPLCERPSELGIQAPGGLAELVVAPARNVHELPDGVSPAAAALVEPLACALHGCDRAGIRPGDSVAVVGAGAQGLLHVALARLSGASRVMVFARHESRRRRALRLGAELAPEDASADVAIDASGSAAGCARALATARAGGRVLLHGAAGGATLGALGVHARELTVAGSLGAPPSVWPRAIALIASGRVDPAALIDAEWPLGDAPHALERLKRDRSLVKGLIRVAR